MLIKTLKSFLAFSLLLSIVTIDTQSNPSYSSENSNISKEHKFQVSCYSPGTNTNDTVIKEDSNKVYTRDHEPYLYVDLDNGTQQVILNLPCIVTEKNGSESAPKAKNTYRITCYSPGATDGNIIFATDSPKIKSFKGEEIIFVDLPNGDRVGITNLACITARK